MAVIDLNTSPQWDAGEHDVAIIGAGAAGLYLAAALSPRLRVIVLECGDLHVDPVKQRLNEVEVVDRGFLSAVDGRRRAVGGTTLAWGGQSLPFSNLDFEQRPWVPGSGWPIDGRTLWRHYQNANRAMGIDELNYDEDIFRLLRKHPVAFDRDLIHFHFSKWAPEPNFRRIFARQIKTAFTVVANCNCVDVSLEGPRVRGVICRNWAGAQRRFSCKRLIIATGGLESNRFLLWMQNNHRFLNDAQQQKLGTGFMEHPCIHAGALMPAAPYSFQKQFNTQLYGGRKYSFRMSGADAWQRLHRRLNVTAAFVMKRADDFVLDPYTEFRDFKKVWSTRGGIQQTAVSLGATAWAVLWSRFVYKRGAVPTLTICSEQEPLSSSRLSLAETKDQFGVPRLKLKWDLSRATWDTIASFAQVIDAEVSRIGFGRLMLRPELLNAEEPRLDLLYDIGHHMGGTAMGSNKAESVVDPDLKIRGIENAWICSASTFPTGSHSNPTLTVLALADRLVQHLTATA